MGNVRIFTNSVSDLSPELAKDYNVGLVPDVIVIEGREYLNNVDIAPPRLYELLRTAQKLPTTSHPNVYMYCECFRAAADCEEILCINLTSKMSGSYNTATLAARTLEEEGFGPRVYAYDSLQVSFGLTTLVLEAAQMARAGHTAAQIIQYLNCVRDKVGVYFVMRSLANAKKGGRVGAIKALTADLLGIKPVLMFRDGTVTDVGLSRNFEQGLKEVAGHYKRQADYGREVIVFHANNEKDARTVRDLILQCDPAACVRIEWVGAVIGIYTGEGCVGVAFRE